MDNTKVVPQLRPHGDEVRDGARFEFGKNWSRFLTTLDERRIISAERSLQQMLSTSDLTGKTFCDIGSGSGIFSLVARRLGGTVHSFDFDPYSVGCTSELRSRFFPNDPNWGVEEASALDPDYISILGQFDVVYSWGVLHHTGQMWLGLEHAHRLVTPGGLLFIAIYNDQGSQSTRWRYIKRVYNRLPKCLQAPYAVLVSLPNEFKALINAIINRRTIAYAKSWVVPEPERGMNRWHDLIDWVGGYPYEVATPDEIFNFYTDRGYILTRLHVGGVGLGCNEFVFRKAV